MATSRLTVVLGYVPKPEGEAALAAAIAEAVLRGADLILVNAHRPASDDQALQRLAREVDEARGRAEAAGLRCAVETPEIGLDASEELVRIAEEVGADLIVIGLRRRTSVGKLILGSNAQRILLDAHCPVLAVKSD